MQHDDEQSEAERTAREAPETPTDEPKPAPVQDPAVRNRTAPLRCARASVADVGQAE